METLKCKKAVYSYYFPETRKVVEELTRPYPHELFIDTYEGVGRDDFHKPLIEQFIRYNKERVTGLETFPYRYFTAGSSEGLFHILAHIAAFEPKTPCYTFRGEYEGYAGYGGNLGLNFATLETDSSEIKQAPAGIFFISNPSARNGNILPDEIINKVLEVGHQVVLDLTYVGLIKPHVFSADHPNLRAVVFSMSKPFGVFYHRVGLTFTKEEMLTLEPNKWFKNLFSIKLGMKLLETLPPEYIYQTYHPLQEKIINYLNKTYELNILPSDVILLGYMDAADAEKRLTQEQLNLVDLYKRERYYRFCLSPYFLEYERDSKTLEV